eukprot:gb/GFBE01065148.1/.p1 GENE.gb/GFBE01065148.1/~~gb/GFBE01065148.1/.p1  ORF type:complete len:442 (+),score=92.33 gb/GFBE01065148.1/:1-1326(+)
MVKQRAHAVQSVNGCGSNAKDTQRSQGAVSAACGKSLWRERWRQSAALLCTVLASAMGIYALRQSSRQQRYRQPGPAPESAKMLWRLGLWHEKRDQVDSALTAYHWAKQVHQHADSLASPLGVALLADITRIFRTAERHKSNHDEVIRSYEELIDVLETSAPGEARDELLAQLADPVEELKRLGMALQSSDTERETEIRMWQVAVEMCRATGRAESIKGAELLTRVGVAISRRPSEDPHLVMKYYTQAKDTFYRANGTKSHWYGILVHNIGVVLSQLGDKDGELKSFEEAVSIYESIGMVNSETYAGLLYELASGREEHGNLEGGREAFWKANDVFDRNVKLRSNLRAFYANNVGLQRRDRQDLAGALQAFEVAVRAHRLSGSLQTTNGKAAQWNLEDSWQRLRQLPEVEQRMVQRRLEILRRPSEPVSSEEGAYLQHAGR